MICKICKSNSTFIFSKLILQKYNCRYYKCSSCEFIQTETPYWLSESYSSPIANTDIGLLHRNLYLAQFTKELILKHFVTYAKFLDFAGGYGVFVRLMRDRGFDFYREDKYCENLFAKYFDMIDLNHKDLKFEIVTLFEVFEHLENPQQTLNYLLSMSDNIFFSTELQPTKDIDKLKNWWYIAPHMGQHIAFYSIKTLEYLAKDKKYFLYSDKLGLHLFTKNKLKSNPFRKKTLFERILNRLFPTKIKLQSLLQIDSQMIMDKL